MDCPEDLLDKRSSLVGPEKRALEEHTRACGACAVEQAVASFVDSAPGEGALDRLAARACEGAMVRVARARSAQRRRRVVVALSFAAACAVGVAAAATWRGFRAPRESRSTDESPVRAAVAEPATGAAKESAETIPTVSVEDLARAPTAATTSAMSRAPSVPETPDEDAATIFVRANRLRQSGSNEAALRLYRDLEKRYPASGEAAVARISAARLLVAAGDARAALTEYDAYLADERRVELREEAVVGRARVCATLGLANDELHAWEMLLRDFPSSIHAPHARERLAALGTR